jgi:hypothetical protein
MGFVVLLVTCLLCCGSAEAGQIKYTYLKVGQRDMPRLTPSRQNKPAKPPGASTMPTGTR